MNRDLHNTSAQPGPGHSPGPGEDPDMPSLPRRLGSFFLIVTAGFLFFYFLLPLLNDSFTILRHTSARLDALDIDPTRYYYTDVAQVREGEEYIRTALNSQPALPPPRVGAMQPSGVMAAGTGQPPARGAREVGQKQSPAALR